MPSLPPAPPAPPTPVRIAAAVVGVEALLALGAGVLFGIWSEGSVGARIGEASYFLIVAVGLGFCAGGLWRGHAGARTPSIVAQLLLVPVVYSTLGNGNLALGIPALVVLVGTFLLLVSEPARRWSVGADSARRD